jgi:hypothetical protein
VKEVTAYVVETGRQLELEVGLELGNWFAISWLKL